MALSRAYLAAHWLSDAMAGVLLGTSTALATALVVHHLRNRLEHRHLAHGPPIGVTVSAPGSGGSGR
jgi:membrane-associated phospholipid phosphatase